MTSPSTNQRTVHELDLPFLTFPVKRLAWTSWGSLGGLITSCLGLLAWCPANNAALPFTTTGSRLGWLVKGERIQVWFNNTSVCNNASFSEHWEGLSLQDCFRELASFPRINLYVRVLINKSLPLSLATGEEGKLYFPVSISYADTDSIISISTLSCKGGAGSKEPACQCRRRKRCGFHPWVGKIPWRRKWPPTPVFLPGESHGQRSLAGYGS